MRVSTERRKLSSHSCRESNPRSFDQKSDGEPLNYLRSPAVTDLTVTVTCFGGCWVITRDSTPTWTAAPLTWSVGSFCLRMHTGDLSVSVVGTVVYTAKIQTQKGSNERFFKFIFLTRTQYANFEENPLCQATKRRLTDKRLKAMKNEWE